MQVNNLKAYLANIGMTTRDFSEIIDVTENYMSSIIHGKRRAGPRLAKDVLQATDGLISLPCRTRKKDQKNDESQNENQEAVAV